MSFVDGLICWTVAPGFLLAGSFVRPLMGQRMYKISINPSAPRGKCGMSQLLKGRNGDAPHDLQRKTDQD